jgi:hypothetical protein
MNIKLICCRFGQVFIPTQRDHVHGTWPVCLDCRRLLCQP